TSGPSLLPSTAVTGAYSASSARTAAGQTSPACRMRSAVRRGSATRGGQTRHRRGAGVAASTTTCTEPIVAGRMPRLPAGHENLALRYARVNGRSGRGGSAWLVHVAGVDVVDGRHDRGERTADLFGGFPPPVLCLRVRRGGGEPPGGVEAPAVAFGRLDGPV